MRYRRSSAATGASATRWRRTAAASSSCRTCAQLRREIRAQFEAFAASGLPLDHVNAHKHFHLHPTVLSMIIDIGRDYGLRAVRLPYEASASALLAVDRAGARARLDRAGLAHNDYVVGIEHTGAMDERVLLDALAALPPGVGEIYCHPAEAGDGPITPTMADYRPADELAALLSPRVAAALKAAGVATGGFADVFGQRAARRARSRARRGRSRRDQVDQMARLADRHRDPARAGPARGIGDVADDRAPASRCCGSCRFTRCRCCSTRTRGISCSTVATLPFLWWIATVREAVNRLLPVVGIGGELVGIRLARWQVADASRVTASVIVEVLVTIVVQYAFAALGLVLLLATTHDMGGGTIGLALVLTLPLPVLGVVLMRRGGVFHAIERFAGRLLGDSHRLLQGVDGRRLDRDIDALMSRTALLFSAFFWQLAGYVLGALEIYWALALLGHPVSIGGAVAIEAMTQAVRHAAFMVPGGLGAGGHRRAARADVRRRSRERAVARAGQARPRGAVRLSRARLVAAGRARAARAAGSPRSRPPRASRSRCAASASVGPNRPIERVTGRAARLALLARRGYACRVFSRRAILPMIFRFRLFPVTLLAAALRCPAATTRAISTCNASGISSPRSSRRRCCSRG
jgi:predicted glycoside hydrolase/deacetylase ChbG (UPF0249 family)